MLGLFLASIPAYSLSEASQLTYGTGHIAQQPSVSTCSEGDIDALIERWRTPYWPAGAALRNCGENAVLPLIEVMNDEAVELPIRQWTALLLAQIGTEVAVQALLDVASDEAFQPAVLRAFKSTNPTALSLIPLLTNEFQSPDAVKARLAAIGLAQLDSADATSMLLQALRTEETQEAGFTGLGEINPKSSDAIEVLISALDDEQEIVRVGAAYGLAEIGSSAETAIPKLVELVGTYDIRDESETVRGTVAYALGKINPSDQRALEALIRLTSWDFGTLYEPSGQVRIIASEALAAIDQPEDIYPLLARFYRKYDVWAALQAQPDHRLIEIVRNVLLTQDMDTDIRRGAIRVIGMSGLFQKDSAYSLLDSEILTEEDFQNLVNDLSQLITDPRENIALRSEAAYALAEFVSFYQSDYEISDAFIFQLIQSLQSETTHPKTLKATIYSLARIYTSMESGLAESTLVAIESALVNVLRASDLYQVWDEDLETTANQNLVGQEDSGAFTFVALTLLLKEGAELKNDDNQALMNRLQADNPSLFESMYQNELFFDESPYIGISILQAHSGVLVSTVRTYQQENRPAVCQFGIARRLIWKCR